MEQTKKRFSLLREGSQKLEDLRKERQTLSSDLYEELDRAEKLLGRIDSEKLTEAGEEMSKIDEGLNQYKDYKQTIAELSEILTSELSEYVALASESENYQGFEKFLSWFAFTKKKADRMRIERIQTSSPRENLKLILDYGEQLFNEIREVRVTAIETFSRLQNNVDILTQKIADYEPQEAQLKEKLDAMEAQLSQKREIYDNAESSQQAELITEINDLEKQLTDVRHEYDQVFTIYNQAQQALAANQQTRAAFENMVRDLGRQATMIKEKIDNVTEVYMAAPEAVKVMMTTKGMEAIDESINQATDRSVDMITKAAQSVSDATLNREEVQLIDESVMRGYMERMEETMRDFNERFDKIREGAQRSQNDRYGE